MDNKTLVRNMLDNVYNKHDASKLSNYYAEKCVYQDSMTKSNGIAELRKATDAYMASFTNMKVVVNEQLAEGDYVTTRMTCSGKDTGGFMGRPATGKNFEFTAIEMDRVRDSKITETWFQGDFLGMLQQLGTIPRFDTTRTAAREQPHAK